MTHCAGVFAEIIENTQYEESRTAHEEFMNRPVYSLVPERPSGSVSGPEPMVDHQPELAHRLALTLRPLPIGAGVGGPHYARVYSRT